MKRPIHFTIAALALAALAGCSATPAAETQENEHVPEALSHVHGIVPLGDGRTVLIGTHAGLFTADDTGILDGPIGGYDFDAMGLTDAGETLIASGHPGATTPAEFGSPHLGIIRSDDGGVNWQPVALTGEVDFHVLTAGPDGQLYGVGSNSPAVVTSSDFGATWTEGAVVGAVDLAATADALYAATPEGLQVSTDDGRSFTPIADAPLFYQLETTPEGAIVGVDTGGALWHSADGLQWESVSSTSGMVQALGVAGDGTVALVDDRGLVWMLGSEEVIIPLTQH